MRPELAAEFLEDPRHEIAVAIQDGRVVAMASGVCYVHPDKPAELFVNELGTAPAHRGRGLGKAVLQALLARGRERGCREAWVLTDRGNPVAMRVYASLGGEENPTSPTMFTFRL